MTARLLESLNGAAIFTGLIVLIWLGRYFRKEAIRRGLRPYDWLKLPPSMNLALAMFIFDAAISFRLATTVIWYAIGEKLIPIQTLFIVAILGIIVGWLCKIKALTEPEYGKLPWILSMILTAALVVFLFMR